MGPWVLGLNGNHSILPRGITEVTVNAKIGMGKETELTEEGLKEEDVKGRLALRKDDESLSSAIAYKKRKGAWKERVPSEGGNRRNRASSKGPPQAVEDHRFVSNAQVLLDTGRGEEGG